MHKIWSNDVNSNEARIVVLGADLDLVFCCRNVRVLQSHEGRSPVS